MNYRQFKQTDQEGLHGKYLLDQWYALSSVTDPHHIDANPSFHFDVDVDPDPVPIFHSAADPDPDPTFQFDADPDPTTRFFQSRFGLPPPPHPMLRNDPLRLPSFTLMQIRIRIQLCTLIQLPKMMRIRNIGAIYTPCNPRYAWRCR
jgi:hypothetical protein